MREFQEKRLFRKIFFSRPVFLLLSALLVLFSFSVFEIYKKHKHAKLLNQEAENEILVLEEKKLRLKAGINEVQTPEGTEEELRRKFQIKKPGEEYIVIIDNEPDESIQKNEKEKGFLKKLWEIIHF